MHRSSAVLLAVLIASVGCGKKSGASGEVAETPDLPVARSAAPVPATPPADSAIAALPVKKDTPALPPPVKLEPEVVAPPRPAQSKQEVAQLPVLVAGPKDPQPPPASKDPPKDAPKPKDSQWPKEYNGRDIHAFVKDCSDPDAGLREAALRALPAFGPPGRKVTDKDGKNLVAKAILARMDPDREKDTGVRSAAFAVAAVMGFEEETDLREGLRLLGNAISQGAAGGVTRLNAVQALAAFGTKAEPQVASLVLAPSADPAHETRRSVAFTLGRIAFVENKGPSRAALNCLANVLANDTSAVVRAEALQSLVLLGPPWEGMTAVGEKGEKVPKIDEKAGAGYVATLKKRLALAPLRPGEKAASGLVERDKVVEVWVRLAVMRMDPAKELNDDSLGGIAKHASGTDTPARLAALEALARIGPASARRMPDVVGALGADEPQVVATAVNCLGAWGAAAKPAIPDLQKVAATHKDEDVRKLADDAVKFITKSAADAAKKP